MAIPATAMRLPGIMDPSDRREWGVSFSRILQPDETIDSFEITVLAEAAAMGLKIMEGYGRDPVAVTLDDGRIVVRFWPTIAEDSRDDPLFFGEGVSLPIEIGIVTNAVPDREWHFTYLLGVAQK